METSGGSLAIKALKVIATVIFVLIGIFFITGYIGGKTLQANAEAFWGDRFDPNDNQILFDDYAVRWFTPYGGPAVNPYFIPDCDVHPFTALVPLRESLADEDQWEALCGINFDTVRVFNLADIKTSHPDLAEAVEEAFKIFQEDRSS